jgi:hypothetical protein
MSFSFPSNLINALSGDVKSPTPAVEAVGLAYHCDHYQTPQQVMAEALLPRNKLAQFQSFWPDMLQDYCKCHGEEKKVRSALLTKRLPTSFLFLASSNVSPWTSLILLACLSRRPSCHFVRQA